MQKHNPQLGTLIFIYFLFLEASEQLTLIFRANKLPIMIRIWKFK